jgi:hypothetical protein
MEISEKQLLLPEKLKLCVPWQRKEGTQSIIWIIGDKPVLHNT